MGTSLVDFSLHWVLCAPSNGRYLQLLCDHMTITPCTDSVLWFITAQYRLARMLALALLVQL
jgi:hypothetical protein